MSAQYPNSIPTFTVPSSGAKLNNPNHITQHVKEDEEIVAIETELGLNPKGTAASVRARLDTLESSVSGKVAATRTINGKALTADVVLGLASSDFANQGTTNTILHGNADGNPAFSTITEADITLADNTTNDASLTKHGFVPKLPNTGSKVFSDTGAFIFPRFSSAPILAKTANTTLTEADADKLITCDGTFTVSLPAIVDGRAYKILNIGAGTITITPNGAETSDVATLTTGQGVILVGDYTATKWRALARNGAGGGGGASVVRGTFSKADLTWTFTVTGVSTSPTAGAEYTNNGFTYTVVSYDSGTLVCTGPGYPSFSGTLTKASGTGDSTIAFSTFIATYVVTHNLGLSAPYSVCGLNFWDNNNKLIGNIDDVIGAANSMTFYLTTFITMTGSQRYSFIAG